MFERFIARQPIFDQHMALFGYELLFRAGPQNLFQASDEASNRVIVDATMLFDLQTLTGPARAFINADDSALLQGSVHLLPHDRIVVEILETVIPTPEVVQACRDLCQAGYILALDDFVDLPKWQPLIDLAKFLKVDFRSLDVAACRAISVRYRARDIQLLAEKVETHAELQTALDLGYNYFQGYFFCKPTMVRGRDVPGNKLNYLRLLEAVSVAGFSYAVVENILKLEPVLVYKLLRYLNSPLLGLRSEIRSVRQAIAMIGEIEFRRWVSVVAVVALAADKPPELIRTALTRAFFCEEFARHIGMAREGPDLFLMGLLSVTDALLDRPMREILANLPLSADIRSALSGGANEFRAVYDTLLAYERADWPALSAAAARIGPVEHRVASCYLAAAGRVELVAPMS